MESPDILLIQQKLIREVERQKIPQTLIYEKAKITKAAYHNYKTSVNVMGSEVLIRIGMFLKIDFNKLIYNDDANSDSINIINEPETEYKKGCVGCKNKQRVIDALIRSNENLNNCLDQLSKKKSGNVG